MDSLTQIVLGAAVGETVLGRKVGNKAMLYGAIGGTIPDLDVLSSHFTDTVTALEMHRGFTHSIVFSVVFAPLFGYLVSKYEKYKDSKGWSWLFFWAFITHPLLDAHTTWGTQLFWPLDLRLAYKNIFVIDPLYTLPFLTFLILAMRQKRTSSKRRRLNNLGLIVSSGYMILTILFKGIVYHQFKDALTEQNISHKDIQTKPTPLNSILWAANVETEDSFLIGYSSILNNIPIEFLEYPKNHHLLGGLSDHPKVQRMIAISQGWYTITKNEEGLFFNDLRFGTMGIKEGANTFVFRYKIETDGKGILTFTEQPKAPEDGKKLLAELWDGIIGN
ncbi:MAG: metal-dependent hydrolase [Flavobacteriales bacterium]|nr:metal-dependent hydrolase [Flavobacteriales bacterium]